MVPSSALGVVLFVALLAPGLAFVLRHEQVVPSASYSAFRETLRVIFVSVTCLAVTGILFTVARSVFPRYTPDVRGLVQDPVVFFQGHHVQLAWWSLGIVSFATLLGALAADPRVVRLMRRAQSKRVVAWFTGNANSNIRSISAWYRAIDDLKTTAGETFIGAQMSDGTFIRGFLVSYSPATDEDENRELILTRTELRPPDSDSLTPLGTTFSIISARNIIRLDVTHLEKETAKQRPTEATDPQAGE